MNFSVAFFSYLFFIKTYCKGKYYNCKKNLESKFSILVYVFEVRVKITYGHISRRDLLLLPGTSQWWVKAFCNINCQSSWFTATAFQFLIPKMDRASPATPTAHRSLEIHCFSEWMNKTCSSFLVWWDPLTRDFSNKLFQFYDFSSVETCLNESVKC